MGLNFLVSILVVSMLIVMPLATMAVFNDSDNPKPKLSKRNQSLFFSVLVVFLLFSAPLSSAGIFSEAWGKMTGKATSSTTSLNITVGSTAPTIQFVRGNASVTLVEGGAINVTLHFIANDSDGADDLVNSTARIEVNRTGEASGGNRTSSSCDPITQNLNTITYNCSFRMWYFDGAGVWTVNATVQDVSGNGATNQSQTITINLLTAMTMGPTALTWQTLNVTSFNVSANQNITVNNTGNDPSLNINVTTYDLRGEVTPTDYLRARNFSIDNRTSTFGCTGTLGANATGVNITSALLGKGNNTLLYFNTSSGQESLYFCIRFINASVSAQAYSTQYTGGDSLPWNVAVI